MNESNARLRVWNPLGHHDLSPEASLAGIEPARPGPKPGALSSELQRRRVSDGIRTRNRRGHNPECSRYTTDTVTYSSRPGTRTQTWRCLKPLPLPIGPACRMTEVGIEP